MASAAVTADGGLGSAAAAPLLSMARGLLSRAKPETAGLWPRAAALLARQALEEALRGLWAAKQPDLAGCPVRAQLICLGAYTNHESAAGLRQAWTALSRACHHHPYELSPTASELRGWIDAVEAALGRSSGPESDRPTGQTAATGRD